MLCIKFLWEGKSVKRFAILLSILILAFVMAACGNNAQARRMQESDNVVALQQGIVLE